MNIPINRIQKMQAINHLTQNIEFTLAKDDKLKELRNAYREAGYLEITSERKVNEAIREFVGQQYDANPNVKYSSELANQAFDYVLNAAKNSEREVG